MRRDDGSVSLEFVTITPVLLLFIVLAIAAGRIQMVHQAAQSAAQDAAREASLARNPDDALQRAQDAAKSTLASQGIRCEDRGPDVTVGTAGFAAAVGQAGEVTATVVCIVPLADLAVPGVPGTDKIQVTMVSELDRYRGR